MPYCADFETTSETNLQIDGCVRVWLWSLVDCDTKEEWYGYDIESFIETIMSIPCDRIFFHNLRFDGQFLLSYFVENHWQYNIDYSCIIDKLNIWYEVSIHTHGREWIKIWDSSKKYPGQSVQSLAKLYGIEGKKEQPYFDKYRPIDYIPTAEEIEYCLQDSRIVAHAIATDWANGRKGMTLSSDAFTDVKNTLGGYAGWRNFMPLLSKEEDEFCRRAYKGGWVYCNPRYQNQTLENVSVYDVNSLYPYVMKYKPLPYKKPLYRKPHNNELYIVNFDTEFVLKDGFFPTIQVKHSGTYKETEYLTESKGMTNLSLTNIDLELFKKHYDIDYMINEQYMSFIPKTGMLGEYIDKWMKVKVEASQTGQQDLKYISKRWLNSPYGKTGMRGDRINKIPVDETNKIIYQLHTEETDSIYVPYATFVCAWARYITISTAQQNYDNFVYADTDSVHIIGEPHGQMNIHPTDLGAWKHEGTFELGKYLRAKSYIHGHTENGQIKVDEIKCAGMPDSIKQRVEWDQFHIGHEFKIEDGYYKIQQKAVRGGCILVKMPFKIRENLMS